MARYIRTDELLKTARDGFHSDFGRSMADLTSLREVIEDTPTADVVEVKHGEWKHECLECSVFKRNISEICDADSYLTSGIEDELLFCPYCGAKMDVSKMERATERGAE